jgi:hypothetical protein
LASTAETTFQNGRLETHELHAGSLEHFLAGCELAQGQSEDYAGPHPARHRMAGKVLDPDSGKRYNVLLEVQNSGKT